MACASATLTPANTAGFGGRLRSELADLESSDEQLMTRVRGGDQTAFAELMRRHVNSVHTYLVRLTRSSSDAEDLTQETFLRVWRKAHTYRPGRVKVSTWLHRIGHNLCVDQFRKHRELTNFTLTDIPSDAVDQLDQQAARETRKRLETAISTLPENQRAAILLCQVQGFANAQAAEIMGLNVRALESLLARARRTLRAQVLLDEDDAR